MSIFQPRLSYTMVFLITISWHHGRKLESYLFFHSLYIDEDHFVAIVLDTVEKRLFILNSLPSALVRNDAKQHRSLLAAINNQMIGFEDYEVQTIQCSPAQQSTISICYAYINAKIALWHHQHKREITGDYFPSDSGVGSLKNCTQLALVKWMHMVS